MSFEIDPQEVLRLQGYRRPSDVPTREVLDILREAMTEARRAFEPRWVYRELQVASVDRAACRLHEGTEILLRDTPERWGPISGLGLAVCTIGNAIEDRIESLFARREFPLAYMLDSLGSAAVEALADAVLREVCAERLSQGLKVTPRESPGYPRWPIEEQGKVFALAPAGTIGVALNPFCIMSPRKSISFAVGIGREASMGSTRSPCHTCDMRGCAYRRAPRRVIQGAAWMREASPLVLICGSGRSQQTP